MALDIISTINLDLKRPNTETVYAVQYDTAGRIKAQLTNDGEAWHVPSSAGGMVSFRKSDNIGGFYDTTELGEVAVSVDENDDSIIYIALDAQTTITATPLDHPVQMQINFYNSQGKRLSTFAFYLRVQASVLYDGDQDERPVASEWTFRILTGALGQTIKNQEEAIKWMEDNIRTQAGYVVDDTLKVEGAAGDAKKIGELFEEIVKISDSMPGYFPTTDTERVGNTKYYTRSGTSPNYVYTEYTGATFATGVTYYEYSPWNRIWIDPDDNDIAIPTMDDFDEVKSALDSGDCMIKDGHFTDAEKLLNWSSGVRRIAYNSSAKELLMAFNEESSGTKTVSCAFAQASIPDSTVQFLTTNYPFVVLRTKTNVPAAANSKFKFFIYRANGSSGFDFSVSIPEGENLLILNIPEYIAAQGYDPTVHILIVPDGIRTDSYSYSVAPYCKVRFMGMFTKAEAEYFNLSTSIQTIVSNISTTNTRISNNRTEVEDELNEIRAGTDIMVQQGHFSNAEKLLDWSNAPRSIKYIADDNILELSFKGTSSGTKTVSCSFYQASIPEATTQFYTTDYPYIVYKTKTNIPASAHPTFKLFIYAAGGVGHEIYLPIGTGENEYLINLIDVIKEKGEDEGFNPVYFTKVVPDGIRSDVSYSYSEAPYCTLDLLGVFTDEQGRHYNLKLNVDELNDICDNYNKSKQNDYSCLSMFESMGIVGDSWASGSVHTPEGYVDTVYAMSWGQMLGRKLGITVSNYSSGGLTTATWLTASAQYGGLAKLLAEDPKNLYLLNLGINDKSAISGGTETLGTVDDIKEDYTENPSSFYGNYGRIIGNIKEHAPKAIIILISMLPEASRTMDEYIAEIAEKCNIPFIQVTDDEYFTSKYFYDANFGGHMCVLGYSGVANALERLIQKYMVNHITEFAYYDGLTE